MMPRGKSALRSAKEIEKDKSENTASGTSVGLEMKDVEQAAADSPCTEHENGLLKEGDVNTADIGNMSGDSAVDEDSGNTEDTLPSKPKRLFMITGSKKKDAKQKDNGETVNKGEEETNARDADNKADQNELDTGDCKTDSKEKKLPPSDERPKREFFDDEHPYEDPSLVVNNSTTLIQPQDNEHVGSYRQAKQTKERTKMDRNQGPKSPRIKISKSTESIKAAAKAVKKKHPSVMSEHSSPRSIFAFLVALLLSLIVFLSCYFLLHSHAVLSVSVAILVYSIVIVALGFFDVNRMKCLIFLFLPSLFSRGGRLALYVLLLYFVAKGPLCNTIGNIQTVRRSMKCVNDQHTDVLELSRKFDAAQNCVNNSFQDTTLKKHQSVSIFCLQKSCYSVKDRLGEQCRLRSQTISLEVCGLARDLWCNGSRILRKLGSCPDPMPADHQVPCQKEFDEILALLDVNENENEDCGFLEIIGMLLPLLMLLLFHETYDYEKNYRTYNDFHNYFLTSRFQCIDQSRSSCDREAVLPLRKVELHNLVRPSTICQITSGEKSMICKSLKTYVVFLFFVLCIILADLYIYQMFDMETTNPISSVSKNMSNVSLSQNITSNNSMPRMSADPASEVGVEDTCLAKVDSPGIISKVVMPTLLSILLIVILLQAHFTRLQWYVCSKLYCEREKERVFYLYNKILEERIMLVEKCRKRMKSYHREMKTLMNLEPTRIVVHQVPWLSKVFKFFHINLRKCIVCNDSEKPGFTICPGADCSGVYCLSCSFDVDKCLYCDTDLKRSLCRKHDNAQDISSKESLV